MAFITRNIVIMLACIPGLAVAQIHVTFAEPEVREDTLLYIPIVLSNVADHAGASAFSMRLERTPVSAGLIGHSSKGTATEGWGNTVACIPEHLFCSGFDSSAKNHIVESDTLITLIFSRMQGGLSDTLTIERLLLNDGLVPTAPKRISIFLELESSHLR